MPIDLTLLIHEDVRAISRGHQTNAVSIELLNKETPGRIKGIHPKYNYEYISVDFTGKPPRSRHGSIQRFQRETHRDKETEQRVLSFSS